MRALVATAAILTALLAPEAASAQQGFNTAIPGDVATGLSSGLPSGFQSGFVGALAPPSARARIQRDDGYGPQLPEGPFFALDCAPGQVSLNRSGCRPIRELNAGSVSSYDLSIQAMSPLTGLTLSGQTLTLPPGPADPLY